LRIGIVLELGGIFVFVEILADLENIIKGRKNDND